MVLLASGEQELGRAAYHFDASTDTYFASVPVQMDGETGTVSLNFKTYGEVLAVSASYLSENAEVNRAGGVFILRQDTNQ